MLRFTSGLLRGLYIRSPKNTDTRPTTEKVRQAIFNKLSAYQFECVYDLFAGTGALGLEACGHKGVLEVYFIESNPQTFEVLKSNTEFVIENFKKQKINGPSLYLFEEDIAQSYKRLPDSKADLVFCDPPYRQSWFEKIDQLEARYKKISPRGVFLFESDSRESIPDSSDCFELLSRKNYGDSCIHYFVRK